MLTLMNACYAYLKFQIALSWNVGIQAFVSIAQWNWQSKVEHKEIHPTVTSVEN